MMNTNISDRVKETPRWMRGLLLPSWLSFVTFFVAFIIMIVGFSGSKWYRSPEVAYEINGVYNDPPVPIEFGLFWLCRDGHCYYNMRVDYMVIVQIEDVEVRKGYEKYLTPVVVVMTIGFICSVVAMASYLVFLSRWKLSPFFGFPCAGAAILGGVTCIIGCIIFGNTFRGISPNPPFGSSFWLTVIGSCLMIINGAFMIVMSIAAMRNYVREGGTKPRTRPFSFGR